MTLEERLRKEWNEFGSACGTCGWFPLFYELEFERNEYDDDETHFCYEASCVSKDDENSHNHRGHSLFLLKEQE